MTRASVIHAGRIEAVSIDGLVLRGEQITMPMARRDIERIYERVAFAKRKRITNVLLGASFTFAGSAYFFAASAETTTACV